MKLYFTERVFSDKDASVCVRACVSLTRLLTLFICTIIMFRFQDVIESGAHDTAAGNSIIRFKRIPFQKFDQKHQTS